MKPASGCARSLPWLVVAALFATNPLLPSTALAAKGKKAAGKSAKSAGKAASAKSGSSSSGSSSSSSEAKPVTPYEVPSPGGSESSSSSSSTGSTGTDTSTSTSTGSATSTASTTGDSASKPVETTISEPSKDSSASVASTETVVPPEPTPPPVPEEPIVLPEPTPLLVANVGPSTYPGKLRGIEGGSLWLEPSFHGLQWPALAKSGVGLSGMVWLDTGYLMIKRDTDGLPDTQTGFQQGRGLLRVTPTYTDGRFFVQSQVELVGNLCQAAGTVCPDAGTADTDDLWVRLGVWNAWDLQVGRFRAWELFHTGMGLDPYTFERQGAQQLGLTLPSGTEFMQAPEIYGVSYLRERPHDGLGVGYLAFHAYPSRTFRFELLGKVGVSDLASGASYLGGRPTLILDQGWLKLKVAAEYEKASQPSPAKQGNSKVEQTRWGAGAAVQLIVDPRAEFGGSFAYGSQSTVFDEDSTVADTSSYKRASVGGFANVRLGAPWILGLGGAFTWQNDELYVGDSESPNYTAQLQTFLALQYLVAEHLYVKAVFSYARADFVTSDSAIDVWSNTLLSGRVRLMYLY